jgi:hypothetical protein
MASLDYSVLLVPRGSQANVKVMDSINVQKYRTGKQRTLYGGLAKVSPFRFRPPYPGHWHVVVDLGGYGGAVRASVQVLRS